MAICRGKSAMYGMHGFNAVHRTVVRTWTICITRVVHGFSFPVPSHVVGPQSIPWTEKGEQKTRHVHLPVSYICRLDVANYLLQPYVFPSATIPFRSSDIRACAIAKPLGTLTILSYWRRTKLIPDLERISYLCRAELQSPGAQMQFCAVVVSKSAVIVGNVDDAILAALFGIWNGAAIDFGHKALITTSNRPDFNKQDQNQKQKKLKQDDRFFPSFLSPLVVERQDKDGWISHATRIKREKNDVFTLPNPEGESGLEMRDRRRVLKINSQSRRVRARPESENEAEVPAIRYLSLNIPEFRCDSARLFGGPGNMQLYIASGGQKRVTISNGGGCFWEVMKVKGSSRRFSYRSVLPTFLIACVLLPFLFLRTALLALEGGSNCSAAVTEFMENAVAHRDSGNFDLQIALGGDSGQDFLEGLILPSDHTFHRYRSLGGPVDQRSPATGRYRSLGGPIDQRSLATGPRDSEPRCYLHGQGLPILTSVAVGGHRLGMSWAIRLRISRGILPPNVVVGPGQLADWTAQMKVHKYSRLIFLVRIIFEGVCDPQGLEDELRRAFEEAKEEVGTGGPGLRSFNELVTGVASNPHQDMKTFISKTKTMTATAILGELMKSAVTWGGPRFALLARHVPRRGAHIPGTISAIGVKKVRTACYLLREPETKSDIAGTT
ncbi:hypothetical protein ACLOJK_010730 [Asimina triloba]